LEADCWQPYNKRKSDEMPHTITHGSATALKLHYMTSSLASQLTRQGTAMYMSSKTATGNLSVAAELIPSEAIRRLGRIRRI